MKVVQDTFWTTLERFNLLKNLTIDDLSQFSKKYFQQVKIQSLIQGNTRKQDALDVMAKVLGNLETGEILDVSVLSVKSDILRELMVCCCIFLEISHGSKSTRNSAGKQLSDGEILPRKRRQHGNHLLLPSWTCDSRDQFTIGIAGDVNRRATLRHTTDQGTARL